MKNYNRDSLEYRARPLYNGYPIVDECSVYIPFVKEASPDDGKSQVLCDDFYGRFFTTTTFSMYSPLQFSSASSSERFYC